MIKRYRTPLLIMMITVLVVTFRLISPGGFKPDAKKWAEPSFNGSNIMTEDDAIVLPGTKLVICLDSYEGKFKDELNTILLHPVSILDNPDFKKIKNHNGPVLLLSPEPSLSARIWMALAQRGVRNLYIVNDQDDEILKYNFRPDSIFRPEL